MMPESIFHSASVWRKLTARNMVSNEKYARSSRMSYASEDMAREICLDSSRQIAIAGTFLKHCKGNELAPQIFYVSTSAIKK